MLGCVELPVVAAGALGCAVFALELEIDWLSGFASCVDPLLGVVDEVGEAADVAAELSVPEVGLVPIGVNGVTVPELSAPVVEGDGASSARGGADGSDETVLPPAFHGMADVPDADGAAAGVPDSSACTG